MPTRSSLLSRTGLFFLLIGASVLALSRTQVGAAVTLVSFEATPQNNSIRITWETASELNMLGFYVQRADAESGPYARISELIFATGDLIGSLYEFTDTNTPYGQLFYYRLEELETGGSIAYHGPISAGVGVQTPTPTLTAPPTQTSTPTPTRTPTQTSTPTATATPSPTPTPTATTAIGPTVTPSLSFWADQTQIKQGECTWINWSVQNVSAVYYQNQGVTGQGSQFECPGQTTTFTLRATTAGGDQTRQITIVVLPATATPTSTLTRQPTPTGTVQIAPTSTSVQGQSPLPTPTATPTPIPTLTPITAPDAPPTPTATPLPTPAAETDSPLAAPSATPTPSATLAPVADATPITTAAPRPIQSPASDTPSPEPSATPAAPVKATVSTRRWPPPWYLVIIELALFGAGGWMIWKKWRAQ